MAKPDGRTKLPRVMKKKAADEIFKRMGGKIVKGGGSVQLNNRIAPYPPGAREIERSWFCDMLKTLGRTSLDI